MSNLGGGGRAVARVGPGEPGPYRGRVAASPAVVLMFEGGDPDQRSSTVRAPVSPGAGCQGSSWPLVAKRRSSSTAGPDRRRAEEIVLVRARVADDSRRRADRRQGDEAGEPGVGDQQDSRRVGADQLTDA